MFGFFFYIGDDRVRHESLELRAVLGYDPIRNRIGEGYLMGGDEL